MNAYGWHVTIFDAVPQSLLQYYLERNARLESTLTSLDDDERLVEEQEALVRLEVVIRALTTAEIDFSDPATFYSMFHSLHVPELGDLYRLKNTGMWRCYCVFDFERKRGLCVGFIHEDDDSPTERKHMLTELGGNFPSASTG